MNAMVRQLGAALAMGLLACATAAVGADGEPACPALYAGGTVAFTGLFPAIEGRMDVSNFRPGQIVEIDPATMPEADARGLIAQLQALPARVSIYVTGGHCTLGNGDCATLAKAGVRFGPTGSWNWDRDERRIYNVGHPAVIERLRRETERGWRLGANYIRVDNLHHPAGAKGARPAALVAPIFAALLEIEDRLRAEGVIPPERPTGLVAHNNLDVWEVMIKRRMLTRPPVFLTSERTAQLAYKGQRYKGDAAMKRGVLRPSDVAEIAAGRRIAERLGLPYTIAEFQISHDLGGKPGRTYPLPAAYVEQLRRLAGVSEVIVIADEAHYVGRGTVHEGPGPRTLAASPHPPGADAIAAACLGR